MHDISNTNMSFLRKQESRVERSGFRIKCGMTISQIHAMEHYVVVGATLYSICVGIIFRRDASSISKDTKLPDAS